MLLLVLCLMFICLIQEDMWEEEPEGHKEEREYNLSNQTETINKTSPQPSQGFLEDFLDR